MNLKTLLGKLYCFQLIHDSKIYAYSLGHTKTMALDHLKRIIRFHELSGSITIEYKNLVIENILNNRFDYLNTDLKIYRYYRVYEELKKLNRSITYKELSNKTKYPIFNVIRALKHNPFLILLPCHLVVNKDHRSKGYTPLGLEFREKLIRYRNDII